MAGPHPRMHHPCISRYRVSAATNVLPAMHTHTQTIATPTSTSTTKYQPYVMQAYFATRAAGCRVQQTLMASRNPPQVVQANKLAPVGSLAHHKEAHALSYAPHHIMHMKVQDLQNRARGYDRPCHASAQLPGLNTLQTCASQADQVEYTQHRAMSYTQPGCLHSQGRTHNQISMSTHRCSPTLTTHRKHFRCQTAAG